MYYIDNVIDLDKSLLWDFFIVLSLTQYQILMQHMRIYSAWLPSTFPNYGNVVEREKTVVNRLRGQLTMVNSHVLHGQGLSQTAPLRQSRTAIEIVP